MTKLVLKWLLIGAPVLLVTALSYLAAPFAVLFEHNGRLPRWLRWFQTYDRDLYGDPPWQRAHPGLYKTRLGMLLWLWRNPAGTFSYKFAGVWPEGIVRRYGDRLVSNTPNGHSGCCLTKVDNAWLYYHVRQWSESGKCLRIVLGWKLYEEQDTGVCRMKDDKKTTPAQWVMVVWPLAGFNTPKT